MSLSSNEFSEPNSSSQESTEEVYPSSPSSGSPEDSQTIEPTPADSSFPAPTSTTNSEADRPMTLADLPPEAQGEQNGGPLGCCLGIMVGLVLSLTVGIVSRFYPDLFVSIFGEQLSLVTRILMLVILIVAAILFGNIGWRLGKRFYREYEPSPRHQRKMAELEARQQAIDRRRRQKSQKSQKNTQNL